MRLKPLSLLLAMATSLWASGFTFIQQVPVAHAADEGGRSVIGTPDSIRESGLHGQALRDAVQGELNELKSSGSSVKGSNVTGAPSISESAIALLPATMSDPDSWNGLTVQDSDPSGRVFVTWLDGREASPGLSSVFFSRSLDGGATWSTPARVDRSAGVGTVGFGLNMAADDAGHVYIIWNDTRDVTPGQLYFSRSLDSGATWSAGAPLTFESRVFDNTSIAVDNFGHVYVTWEDARVATSRIFSLGSSNMGTTWTPEVLVDDAGAGFHEHGPIVAAGRQNELGIIWRSDRAGGAGADLFFARSTDGGATFAADARINDEAAGTRAMGQYAQCNDGNGMLYTAWMNDEIPSVDPDRISVRTSSNFGATFPSASSVVAPAVDSADPMVLACAFGSSHVAIGFEEEPVVEQIVAVSNDGGASWSSTVVNDAGNNGSDTDEMVIDIDAAGHVLAAWTDSRNGSDDVFVNWSLDNGATWQTSNLRATNTPNSGTDSTTLTSANLGAANDRLGFNLTYHSARTGARGLYASTATFEGSKSGMSRVAGSDRYKTGVAISQAQFPTAGTVSAAVFATGENFPDGLGGTALAAMVGGPVLLVKQNALPAEVAAEFLRIYDKNADAKVDAYVLGGTSAVSAGVETAIKALDPSVTTKRLGASNRKGTAIEVAKEMDSLRGRGPRQLVLARANDFPDALTGGAVAGNKGIDGDLMSVLLTDTGSLDAGVKAYLSSVAATLDTVHVFGGTSAVSAATAAAADAVAKTVVRHSGINRAATATQVATDFYKGTLAPQTFGLASSAGFADALTGGLWAAMQYAPLLLTDPATLSTETGVYLATNAGTIDSGVAFGGTAAIADVVLAAASLLY